MYILNKPDDKIMNEVILKEKQTYSIKKVPVDPDSFFENFINIFLSYNFTMGFPLTVGETGPRENLKTTFQFIGMMGMNLNCAIRFEIESSKLTVFSQLIIEVTLPSLGFGKKMLAKRMEKNFRPLMAIHIQKAVEEAFNPKKKEIKSGTGDADPLKQLKLRLVNGEISEEEYLRKKNLLEE